MSLLKRKIELTFSLGAGDFGFEGANQVTVKDLRVQCSIRQLPGPSLGNAHVRVYGLSESLMNDLSALNKTATIVRSNALVIRAGDDKAGMSVVFDGQIMLSQIDMTQAPEVALNIHAVGGLIASALKSAPKSYPSGVDAAVILQNLAREAGMLFENAGVAGGVHPQLYTPYYHGSVLDQIRAVANDAGIEYAIDSSANPNTLAIWPRNGARGGAVPLVSRDTGLVGYPSYSSGLHGIAVKTIFNPQIKVAGKVKVESDLKVANREWTTFNVYHELDAEVPGGEWFTRFDGAAYG